MGPHQGSVEGEENLPRPAGHTPLNAPQDPIGFLGNQGTLLAHGQLVTHQHTQVPLRQWSTCRCSADRSEALHAHLSLQESSAVAQPPQGRRNKTVKPRTETLGWKVGQGGGDSWWRGEKRGVWRRILLAFVSSPWDPTSRTPRRVSPPEMSLLKEGLA